MFWLVLFEHFSFLNLPLPLCVHSIFSDSFISAICLLVKPFFMFLGFFFQIFRIYIFNLAYSTFKWCYECNNLRHISVPSSKVFYYWSQRAYFYYVINLTVYWYYFCLNSHIFQSDCKLKISIYLCLSFFMLFISFWRIKFLSGVIFLL